MSLEDGLCPKCKKPSARFRLNAEGVFVCSHCMGSFGSRGCRPFEYGHENSSDPKGSTAHVRDIKDRRWHPTEKRPFYYSKELGKTYFYKKG